MKQRLDHLVLVRGLAPTRSQAESYIRLGQVLVNGKVEKKPGFAVPDDAAVTLTTNEHYVSRAGLKLASIAKQFQLDFKDATVLDVGSSTGGFTDYALQHGAKKVFAIDVGTNQLHPTLRGDERIELHEQTNILEVGSLNSEPKNKQQHSKFSIQNSDIVVIDVSFVSLRTLLPHIATLVKAGGNIVAMVKPQFEATAGNMKHKGVIKNDRMRRDILKDFEAWATQRFIILDKADSAVAGEKGNLERFYKLRKLHK